MMAHELFNRPSKRIGTVVVKQDAMEARVIQDAQNPRHDATLGKQAQTCLVQTQRTNGGGERHEQLHIRLKAIAQGL